MSVLKILQYPDPGLRTHAAVVEQVDEAIQQLVADMFETMYAAPGIGLAATQVDVHKRVIVIDISPDKTEPLCLINPAISERDGEVNMEEGCLSVPGIYEQVKRAERVKVEALDRTGQPFELEASDMLGVCIQHEMDHLEGKVFVDYLSPLKQQRIGKKMEKQHKQDLQYHRNIF